MGLCGLEEHAACTFGTYLQSLSINPCAEARRAAAKARPDNRGAMHDKARRTAYSEGDCSERTPLRSATLKPLGGSDREAR